MLFLNDQINIFTDFDFIQFVRRTYGIGEEVEKSIRHMHQHFELYIMLSGTIEFVIEENRRTLYPGDIALMRVGEYHITPEISTNGYDHCYFQFTENSFPKLDEKMLPLFDCFLARPFGSMNYFRVEQSEWAHLTKLIDRLCGLIRKSEFGESSDKSNFAETAFAKYSIALEILTIVSRQWRASYADEAAQLPNEQSAHPIVAKALSYISRDFISIKTVGEIAEYCGVTHAYLTRLFRDKLGTTPSNLLREKRMAYAIQRLLDGNDVTTVCFDAGFQSYSYFIQIFKKQTGMTPLVFQSSNGVLRR